ncbi:hypothetical protein ACFFIS_05740 [Virgibacillus soli]|uniref:hypothetical protein n=1 Tax=Paracerasibacillus soli TaxID=480284 RepID=UPI0035EF079B
MLLAKHAYFKIEREVTSIEQRQIEHHREICLYTNRVETKHRQFSIEEIRDMSYRMSSKNSGLLYLHTIQGVFSYYVKTPPKQFVEAFQQHVKSMIR